MEISSDIADECRVEILNKGGYKLSSLGNGVVLRFVFNWKLQSSGSSGLRFCNRLGLFMKVESLLKRVLVSSSLVSGCLAGALD